MFFSWLSKALYLQSAVIVFASRFPPRPIGGPEARRHGGPVASRGALEGAEWPQRGFRGAREGHSVPRGDSRGAQRAQKGPQWGPEGPKRGPKGGPKITKSLKSVGFNSKIEYA